MYIYNNQNTPSFGAGKIKYIGHWSKKMKEGFKQCPYVQNALVKKDIVARNFHEEANMFDCRYSERYLDYIEIKVFSNPLEKLFSRFKKWTPLTNNQHNEKTLIEKLLSGKILKIAIDKLNS